MAITTANCNSWKQEILNAVHNFSTHTFYTALYTSSASLDATTTVYSATNEITGTAYVAGGQALTGGNTGLTSGTAWASFNNVTWSSAAFTANGCLLYNSSASNKSVVVYAFGGDKTVAGGSFTLTWPATGATAMIRIA